MKIPEIKQLPSGMWRCQLRLDGQSISITDEDYDVVDAKARAYKTGVLQIKKCPEKILLRDACWQYIEDRGYLSPATLQGYKVIVEHRYQNLMDMRVCDITPAILKRETARECNKVSPRTGKRLSAKTMRNTYHFVVSVLREYMPDARFKVSLPEMKRKPVQVLTPEEIFPVIKGTSVELPCLLAMWLSLSMSEIRGLTKSKSIRNGQISIVETVVDVDGQPVRKEGGKEELRSRTLDIPPYIQSLIDKVDGDIIVPETAQTISKRFYRLLDKAGLPHMNFHKLRHINASVMVELGIPEKEALERGGWKTDHVYKAVYSHTFSRQRKQADAKINSYFSSIVETTMPSE